MYVKRTAAFRRTDQRFVSWASPRKDKPLSSQRLSHWIVEAITLTYKCKGARLTQGVRAHSIWGMASSWVLFGGMLVQYICTEAVGLHLTHLCAFTQRPDVAHQSLPHAVLKAGVAGLI